MRCFPFLSLALTAVLLFGRPGAAALAQAPDPAPRLLTTYSLPVAPTNLATDADGNIWFTSFTDHAFGRLIPPTHQVETYYQPAAYNVWGVARDAAGRMWFGTVNGYPDHLISRDPAGEITSWLVNRTHIYGLAADPATSDIWFATGTPPAINRLAPAAGLVTSWSTDPYSPPFDLALSPDGMVWVTVKLHDPQVLLRLNPLTSELTAWELPVPTAAPFRLVAPAADAIWLSESDPTGNALARFVPATNQLHEYPLPLPAAWPKGIAAQGPRIWATLNGPKALAALDTDSPSGRVTLRAPVTVATMPTVSAVPTVTGAQDPPRASTTTVRTSWPQSAAAAPFELTALPAASDIFGVTTGPRPGEVWFTATDPNIIGRLQPQAPAVRLPIILH